MGLRRDLRWIHHTVLLYYTSYGWTPWSYNGGLYGDYNTGDASHVIFATFYEYLYYYP